MRWIVRGSPKRAATWFDATTLLAAKIYGVASGLRLLEFSRLRIFSRSLWELRRTVRSAYGRRLVVARWAESKTIWVCYANARCGALNETFVIY